MNNIHSNQMPSTYSSAAVMVIGGALHLLTGYNVEADNNKSLSGVPYSIVSNSSTYSRTVNTMTGELPISFDRFENAITRFYANLLSNQEALGADFETVLNDNLWDLYES